MSSSVHDNSSCSSLALSLSHWAGSCHAANAAAVAAQIFTIISSQFLARKAGERDKEEFIWGEQIPQKTGIGNCLTADSPKNRNWELLILKRELIH